MGAGAGAQKITTDVTGNDTAGMVAGMVASGVTAKAVSYTHLTLPTKA